MSASEDERRLHTRFAIHAPLLCTVQVQGYQSILSTPGKVRNLSASGALLELPHRVPPGAMLTLSFDTPTGLIQLECEVAWATAGGSAGTGPPCTHGLQFPPTPGGPDQVLADLLRHYADAGTLPGEAGAEA
jgi:PilZ domain-containing protein